MKRGGQFKPFNNYEISPDGIVSIFIESRKYGLKVCKISIEDLNRVRVFRWNLKFSDGRFYVHTCFTSDGNVFSFDLHRLIMSFPLDKVVDHKDGDGLNNTRGNLRDCSNGQNIQNSLKRKQSSSKYKGVTLSSGKWQSEIMKDKVKIYIGKFDNEEDAARAYNQKAIELFGDFKNLNIL